MSFEDAVRKLFHLKLGIVYLRVTWTGIKTSLWYLEGDESVFAGFELNYEQNSVCHSSVFRKIFVYFCVPTVSVKIIDYNTPLF
jgi:hypothetical protein